MIITLAKFIKLVPSVLILEMINDLSMMAICPNEENLINNRAPIGGVGLVNGVIEAKTVEIDESKFFHRKYHRGQWRAGHWVFGGIERGTRNFFLVEVEQREHSYPPPFNLRMDTSWKSHCTYKNIRHLFTYYTNCFVLC